MNTTALMHTRYRQVLLLTGVLIAIDQVTKYLAFAYLRPRLSVSVIGDFLRFTYLENPGMAFGIEVENNLLLHTLSILVVLIIFYYLFKLRDHPILRFSFAAILGGAFGNWIDRFFRGRVIDFVDLDVFDIHFSGGSFLFWELPATLMNRWPIFNVADMAVSIGMFMIIVTVLLNPSEASGLPHASREEI